MKKLFEPKHIALLGVSQDKSKSGYVFLNSLLAAGYKGKISLLGRQDGELEGLPVYGSVDQLPADIDVAFNLLGPAQTPGVLAAVADRGTAFTVVFTAGFAEMGGEGAASQEALVDSCRGKGMRIVGPNCMGIFNLPFGMNLTDIPQVPVGDIGVISQSGNISVSVWDQARKYDLGFSCFVGFGNQADIPIHEYVDYMGQDEATKVIVMYLEGLRPGSGGAFLEVCSRVSKIKPIVILKGGRGSAGRRAAESHTASLSSSERVYASLFEEAGVVEVHQLEHLLPVAEALMRCPPMKGDDVAIVGSGGGHSTVCTDAVETAGLSVPAYSEALRVELRKQLPAYAPIMNPVDMTGTFTRDPSQFATLTELVMGMDPHFAGVVNYGLYRSDKASMLPAGAPYDYVTAAPLLGQLQSKLGKPFVFYTPYADRSDPSFTAMRNAGVPCFDNVAFVGLALAALRQRGRFLARADALPAATAAFEAPASAGVPDYRTETGAYRLLESYGVKLPEVRTTASVDELVAMADAIGYPVVIKAILPGVAHKSEVGGVRTGVGSAQGVQEAAHGIARSVEGALGAKALGGFMVMRDFGRCRELIVGVRRDISLPTLGVIGLGGVLAEALDDVAVCMLPATPERVARALERLSSAKAWGAFRGEPEVSASAVADLLNRLDQAVRSDGAIQSIECNPVLLVGAEIVPVDAAIETL
nr:acetate--CoA ligase family protein [uncultured Duganella sp.]